MRNERDAPSAAAAPVGGDPVRAAAPETPTTHKEKRSWFHSLTRRKKSQSQTSLSLACNTPPPQPQPQPPPTAADPQAGQNNNNAPPNLCGAGGSGASGVSGSTNAAPTTTTTATEARDAVTSRKRKDEKNFFQRIRKKMGLRFPLLRHHRRASAYDDDDDDDDDDDGGGGDGYGTAGAGGTTDASAEFLTHSPIREPQLTFSFACGAALEEHEIVPFTHDYKRFIVKKWMERDTGPNRVMYKACSEMLSQVWYWGEISRRDAQKQLTDKPTGSFLVRDSETSGCQFTLSFRIINVTLHYRLEYRDSYWHFEELQYESIVEMIEDILYRCTNDNYICFVKVPNEMQPQFPVILKYPLSRYLKMPLLQDLCRRVIQRHATADEIAKLPIPPKLQEYLAEKRELVFQS